MLVNPARCLPFVRQVITGVVIVALLGGMRVAGAVPLIVAPVLAQTTNQSYDCGSYGAGAYGSNDCLAAAASPTPPPPPTGASPAQSGGLPGTGAQLVWLGVIGLALILGGVGLSLRRRRHRTPSPIR